ncbi:hypothetical protein HYH03_003931 [Edaphochlamys debaryana]|uniref:Uncharacterized protein n=1 Tax=Edaphochlamys debaryana TaxID=47281 RepID=A0A836C2M2_9CHLO|nr:hypothetical protein HYH03_003931 [Edaphochlamys debaryana]|eukprot:KAG2498176.1 hypothetical protein HYH03_003931 [Edaphochlamys debaryana]
MSQANNDSCQPDGSGPHVADNAGPGGASDGASELSSYTDALSVLGAAERPELLRVTTELLTLEAPADEAAAAAAEAAMAAAAAAEAAAAAAQARKLAERERKEQQRRQRAAAAKPGPEAGSEVEAGGTTQLPLLLSSKTVTEPAEHGHSGDAPMAPPPLAVGPGGLLNPGYCRTGFLRRPYVLQLAWAAAGWRATGLFPYPAVRDGPGPPMLREGPGWAEALAEAEWLLPTLLSRVEPSASPAAAWDATAHSHASATPATPAQPPATPEAASPGTSCPQPPGPELQVPTSPVSLAPATDTAASDRSSEADPAVLCRLLLRAPLLLVLLGFRRTPGSAEALVGPPSAAQCWGAFEAPHEARGAATRLTVGARALSKHCHRDTRAEWWPQMSGPDPRKNAAARGALAGLLRGAVWLNLHTLPPFDAPTHVLELRTARGYGARWAVQGPTGPMPGSYPGPSSAAAGEAEAEAKAAADQDSAGRAKAAEAPGGMDQARADDSTERGAAAQWRWAVSFRGFLEPSMEGGHEAGWRH